MLNDNNDKRSQQEIKYDVSEDLRTLKYLIADNSIITLVMSIGSIVKMTIYPSLTQGVYIIITSTASGICFYLLFNIKKEIKDRKIEIGNLEQELVNEDPINKVLKKTYKK